MARPLSLDLRQRVADALAGGMTVRTAALRFGISAATAVRIGQLDRSGRGLAPAKMGGHVKPMLRGAAADEVHRRLAAKPDWTVRALAADLKAAGIDVSHDTVWRFLRREGKTFKKTLIASEQDRPKVARLRSRWKTHQHRLDPRRLVFVDETWVKTNMTRTRGWCQRGQPLFARIPHGHWKTLTFLAGLRHDRIVAPFVLDGPINGIAFTAWVEQCLAPTLNPGDIVILDNLGSHKGKPARNAIRDTGAHLFFLPPYSPDLNPIEMMFAKLKTLLRKSDERSVDATWRRVGELLKAFSPHECAAYLRHAGYVST
ncbi:IS630 family transposase [Sinorhizobium arboris]|uniref:IS630 family transposase n=1 Tax=Sinorhizobium arboris TaxID=76745 RepID=UPI001F2F590C|nr:IS630 family transposase [Sinorhizobium arboris]